MWTELACIVGCTSPDGHAELTQVKYYQEQLGKIKNEVNNARFGHTSHVRAIIKIEEILSGRR